MCVFDSVANRTNRFEIENKYMGRNATVYEISILNFSPHKMDANLRLCLLTVPLHEYVNDKEVGKHQSKAEGCEIG